MTFFRFLSVLMVLFLILSGCSKEEKVPDSKQEAFQVLKEAVSNTTDIFEKNTTYQPKVEPVLNPQYGTDLKKVKATLNQNFDEKITKKLMNHYLTDQTRGEFILLRANKHGAVEFYFHIYQSEQLDLANFIVEGEPHSYRFITKDHHTFTLNWINATKEYKIVDYM